jgi:hypothetical protein
MSWSRWVTHPIARWRWYKHSVLDFPKVGEYVTYHDDGPYRVVNIDEYRDLDLDINDEIVNVNWNHCCGKVK